MCRCNRCCSRPKRAASWMVPLPLYATEAEEDGLRVSTWNFTRNRIPKFARDYLNAAVVIRGMPPLTETEWAHAWRDGSDRRQRRAVGGCRGFPSLISSFRDRFHHR
jgi:hypothetical protein